MSHVNDITGQKFGRLTVEGRDGNLWGQAAWACKCDCGCRVTVAGRSLRTGHTKSCGCLKLEMVVERSTTHNSSYSPEYKSWAGMKDRCLNKSHHKYPIYGGRGITICQGWVDSFEAFLRDMGNKPGPTYSIDRIDNDGNYEPSNCRWATKTQQSRNRSGRRLLTAFGKTLTITEWSIRLNLPVAAIRNAVIKQNRPMFELLAYRGIGSKALIKLRLASAEPQR